MRSLDNPMTEEEMTVEKALAGFPLSERERTAMKPPAKEQKCQIGVQTRDNLLDRKWIRQIGTDESYARVFVTTPEGVLAIQLDDIAIAGRMNRPSPIASMARPGAYRNLRERLEFLRATPA
jgi:hypothetical protein